MNHSDEHLRAVIDKIFWQFDKNKNGTLELREVAEMINLTLKHNNIMKKFSIDDAKDFLVIADSNKDNKISKNEMFVLLKKMGQDSL